MDKNTKNLTATVADIALEEAISQLGQHEDPKGSNSGPMVDKYLAAVGLKPGYAWCQAFVNWCYEEAAKKLGIPEPVLNTGGVMDCWNRTSLNKKILKIEALRRPELVTPGCQFILSLGKGLGHTGIVERLEKKATGWVMHTIEGNTDDAGGREGYKVCRKERALDNVVLAGFIKYA